MIFQDYTLVVGFVVFSLIALYKWLFSSFDYWEKQGVPCHNPGLLKTVLKMKKKDMHIDEMELYKKYGRIYGRYDGQIPVLTVGEPDVLKEILEKDHRDFYNRRFVQFGDLVTDKMLSALNDADWKRVRNVLSPTFTVSKLRQMLGKVQLCANRAISSLQTAAKTSEPVNLEQVFSAYIMDVIAQCAFGAKINCIDSPDDPFVKHAKQFFHSGYPLKAMFAQFFPFVMKFFHIPLFNPESTAFFRDFILKIIEKRKEMNETGVNFLQLLLSCQRSPGGSEPDSSESSGSKATAETSEAAHANGTKYITQDELISQCVMFFLAGYDTTTSLLQVAMHNIAIEQAIQDRLYEEIIQILDGKETADIDDINEMKYLDAVICESMRLSNSCVRMERQVTNDHFIQSHNIWLKRGQLVSLPYYCIHHDPEWYPDPEKFDPERFTKEAKLERGKFTFLPFGLGPRSCIGSRFALMEVKLCVIMILKHFKVLPCAETKVPLSFRVKLGQLVPEKVTVKMELRSLV